MAGYPPPFQPGFDPKMQRRMLKDQQRAQRDQMRMQRRMVKMQSRRSSIVGPILLVATGIVFLLIETGRIEWWPFLEWFGHWWPLLLIAAGLILLAEWAIDQSTQRKRADQGLPPLPATTRILGGGVIWLLIFVAVLGGLAHGTARTMAWGRDNFRWNFGDFDRALGDPHDSDESISQAVPAEGSLSIDNPRGNVTVSGTSDDGQLHIAVHKEVFSFHDDEADRKAGELRPAVNSDGGHVTITVPEVRGGHADLTVEVPRSLAVTVSADRGDVRVSSMHAPVNVTAGRGSVDLSALTGIVTAHMHNDGATFSAHSITGPVALEGRAGDLNVSDIHGDVSLAGAFSGATHVERINGAVRFKTHRTDFQMARLDGQLDLDSGENLSADQLLGPVVLETNDRNINLDRLQGNVRVVNTNGAVTLTNTSQLGAINVSNRRGSVDIGLPENTGFVVRATTHHGDVENDFSLNKQGSDDRPELSGTVGKGGPEIRVDTTDGDVTLRKSTLPPLPPVPPAPVMLTTEPPQPPAAPKAPAAAKGPAKAATAVKPPAVPKAPPAPRMKSPAAPPAPLGPGDPHPTKDGDPKAPRN